MKKKVDIQNEMALISEKIIKANEAYYKRSTPIMTDAEYDKLLDTLKALEEKYPDLKDPHSPTTVVGSDLDSFLTEKAHSVPILSLDKAYNIDEIGAFITRCQKECSTPPSFTLEEKIDGLSLVLYYENGRLKEALTRGNGKVGNDVTHRAREIKSIPRKLTKNVNITVRGEVYISKKDFEEINETLAEPYSNSRNLASGLLRRLDDNPYSKKLDIFVYEGLGGDITEIKNHPEMLDFLKSLGFRTNPHYTVFISEDKSIDALKDEILTEIKRKTDERKSLGYDIDGLVLKLNSFADRETMGFTEHHPRSAIAYKFESPMGKSKVENIEIGIGRTGRITPVAILSPVNLLGATITRATLHNSDYIRDLELSIGDEVSVSRRGDVIPQIDEVLEKNENAEIYAMPTICPSCGSTLQYKGVNLYCTNPKCPEKIKGEAEYFVSKACMDIDGVGPSVIQTLIDLNALSDYTDIYYIDYDALLSGKEGFKDKKIEGIKLSVLKSKEQPFTRVLASLGIEGIALNTAEKLVNAGINSFDKFIALAKTNDTESLLKVDDIGTITANNIIASFNDETILNRIERLKNAGLKTESKEGENAPLSDVLSGQVWCVTGSIEGYKNPDLALEEVKKRGARIVSSVSKKTTHLLVGSAPGGKLQKAIGFGTILVKDSEFQEFLKNADKNGGQNEQ